VVGSLAHKPLLVQPHHTTQQNCNRNRKSDISTSQSQSMKADCCNLYCCISRTQAFTCDHRGLKPTQSCDGSDPTTRSAADGHESFIYMRFSPQTVSKLKQVAPSINHHHQSPDLDNARARYCLWLLCASNRAFRSNLCLELKSTRSAFNVCRCDSAECSMMELRQGHQHVENSSGSSCAIAAK
jgi:hypothetical protein